MSNQCLSPCATSRICPEGLRYVNQQLLSNPKLAVIACEGACIKGEVARVAANMLAYRLEKENMVRICLGDAATGNSGMIELVKRAPQVVAIEGCPLCCGTMVLRSRLPELRTVIIDASQIYQYDKANQFEIFDIPSSQIEEYALMVANCARERLDPQHYRVQSSEDTL